MTETPTTTHRPGQTDDRRGVQAPRHCDGGDRRPMTAVTDRRRDGGGAAFAVCGAATPHAGPGATGGGAKELHIGSSRTPIPPFRSMTFEGETFTTIVEVLDVIGMKYGLAF